MEAARVGLYLVLNLILVVRSSYQHVVYTRSYAYPSASGPTTRSVGDFSPIFSVKPLGETQICRAEVFHSHGKLFLNDSAGSWTDGKSQFGKIKIDGPFDCTWIVTVVDSLETDVQFRVTSDLIEFGSHTDEARTRINLPLRFYRVEENLANATGRPYQLLATVALTAHMREARANLRGTKFALHVSVPQNFSVLGSIFSISFQRRGECFGSQVTCGLEERECYSPIERCDAVWDCATGSDELDCGCIADDYAMHGVLPTETYTSRRPEQNLFRCNSGDAPSTCYTEAQRCDGLSNCGSDLRDKLANRELEVQFAAGYSPNDPTFDEQYAPLTADEFGCDLESPAYRNRYRIDTSRTRSESPDHVQPGYGYSYTLTYSGMSTSLVVTLVVTVNMTALFAILACAFMQRCRANLSRAASRHGVDRLRTPFELDRPEYSLAQELALESDTTLQATQGRSRGPPRRVPCLSDRVRSYRQRAGRLARYSAYLPFAGALRRAPPPSYDETLQFDEALLAEALLADGQTPCSSDRANAGRPCAQGRANVRDSELAHLAERCTDTATEAAATHVDAESVAGCGLARTLEQPHSSDRACHSRAPSDVRGKRTRSVRPAEEDDDEAALDPDADTDADGLGETDDPDDVALLELPSSSSNASCNQSVNEFAAPLGAVRVNVQLAGASAQSDRSATANIEMANRARSSCADAD